MGLEPKGHIILMTNTMMTSDRAVIPDNITFFEILGKIEYPEGFEISRSALHRDLAS